MLNSIHVSFLSPNTNTGPLRNHPKQTQLKENQKSQQKSIHLKKRQKRHPRSAQQKGEKKAEKPNKKIKNAFRGKQKHIKNLSDKKLTNDQINLLAKGLKYIPTPVTNEMQTENTTLAWRRSFREKNVSPIHFSRGKTQNLIPSMLNLHGKPQVQPSVALESYLEEVKIKLAELELKNIKDKLNAAERETLNTLKRDTNINLKKADKGTTSVVLNIEDNS